MSDVLPRDGLDLCRVEQGLLVFPHVLGPAFILRHLNGSEWYFHP